MIIGRRGLQVTLAVLGTIPLATGLLDVFGGPPAVPGGQQANASVDSVFRFNATFWLATGVLFYWIIPRVEQVTTVLRALMGVVFLGGFARLLSIAVTGAPHPVLIGAIVIELGLPPVLVFWQSRIASTGRAPEVA